ncbi:hypothetical protein TSAR_007829 [Trichomalopsis sarcophagae]|uniref:Uncharacterized protein n=1 Tax=Trichomalopsis sarcophagae TaxID=543379 RepID=A0A232EDW5_9HYME|nr:hypothetical protein TSAR_007829 [Trichomalopsis sarcophagae]
MDSQKPVDDGARSVSMPDNRPAMTDTNTQCPATASLLAMTSLKLLSTRECVTYLKDNIVHFVPKDLNLSTSTNKLLTDIEAIYRDDLTKAKADVGDVSNPAVYINEEWNIENASSFVPERKAKSLSPSPSKPADGLPEDLIKTNKNNSVPSSTVRERMLEHAQKYASPIRAKSPLKNTNACSTALHGELTENLSTIEQKDSEEESEEETFVFQNLSEKLIEENERLEQADNMDSQKPVDDGARSVSMPDNRSAITDTNKQCPEVVPLLGIAEHIAAMTSLKLLSTRECVIYLKDNIVHFVPKDLNLSTSTNKLLTDIEAIYRDDLTKAKADVGDVSNPAVYIKKKLRSFRIARTGELTDTLPRRVLVQTFKNSFRNVKIAITFCYGTCKVLAPEYCLAVL